MLPEGDYGFESSKAGVESLLLSSKSIRDDVVVRISLNKKKSLIKEILQVFKQIFIVSIFWTLYL